MQYLSKRSLVIALILFCLTQPLLADLYDFFEVTQVSVSIWEGGVSDGVLSDRSKFFNQAHQLVTERLRKRGIKVVDDPSFPNLNFLIWAIRNPAFPKAQLLSVELRLRDEVILKRKPNLDLLSGHCSIYECQRSRLARPTEVEASLKDLMRICMDEFERND